MAEKKNSGGKQKKKESIHNKEIKIKTITKRRNFDGKRKKKDTTETKKLEIEAHSDNVNFHEYSDQLLISDLFKFVRCNQVEAMKSVLEKGVSVNAADVAGTTPLHIAAMSNSSLRSLKELLKLQSVSIDKQTLCGETPLFCSCKTSSDKILKILIEHGADVNLSNFEKITPLHIACLNTSLKIVKLLINAGANVNAKDGSEWTPLHKATSFGSLKLCRYLLQHGADANIPNEDGLLPLHFVAKSSIYDLIRSNTKNDAIVTYCTFPGPNGFDMVNRNILFKALESRNLVLTEKILKSDLPKGILNCPVVSKKYFFCNNNYYYGVNEEEQSMRKKLVLFTPLSFLLQFHCWNNNKFLKVLKMLIENDIRMNSTLNISDKVYLTGPVEIVLQSTFAEVDRFKIMNMLLENGIDADEEYNNMSADVFKLCLINNVGNCIFILLLKASNTVEPEDILMWITDFENRDFVQHTITQELVYVLLVLSPDFTVSASEYSFFLTLPCRYVEEENVSEKIRQICEESVRSLSNYCRSVVRRQLHYETRNNCKKFTEKLNSLPAPKTVISYLKFSELKFTINTSLNSVSCQITCDP